MDDGDKIIRIRFLSPSDMWTFIRITVIAKGAVYKQRDRMNTLVAQAIHSHALHDEDSPTSATYSAAAERNREGIADIIEAATSLNSSILSSC